MNDAEREAFIASLDPELQEAARAAVRRTEEQTRREALEKPVERSDGVEPTIKVAIPKQPDPEEERLIAARQEREREEAALARMAAREETWRTKVERDWKRFAQADLGNVTNQEFAEEVRRWLDGDSGNSLICVGGVGAGKTFLAFAAMKEAYLRGKSVKFWPVASFLEALRPGASRVEEALEEASTVDLLVLDDIGTERSTDWTDERMYIVINERWTRSLASIVTSNLTLKGLKAAIKDRKFSRLMDGATVLTFNDSDKRLSS